MRPGGKNTEPKKENKMCDVYSGWIDKRTHEIFMAHPASHSKTADLLKLDISKLSEWEWKRGAEVPEVRTHNDGHSADVRLVNAVIDRFKNRDGIITPMRDAAAKHKILLVTSLGELKKLEKCDELVIDIVGEVSVPALKECNYLYASAATTFSAPALKECNYLDASAAITFSAPALEKVSNYLDARAATRKQLKDQGVI